MTENTTGKIGTICYIMPQALINNGISVIIPPEFTDNVNENNEITGELSIARNGIWKINNELYQFINFDSSVFEYKDENGIFREITRYAGAFLCCGCIYNEITEEMKASPIANNINEYIWQNGDIRVKTRYTDKDEEDEKKPQYGDVIVDENHPKIRLTNTDYMPNTIQIYCQSKDITGQNCIIDKVVFYTAGTHKYDSVFKINAPGVHIYKTGCVAKIVLKDGDDSTVDIGPNVSKTSTDMEYLNGVISTASKAKTKLSTTEGSYVYTANGEKNESTGVFTPSSMMSIGDVVDLNNKKEQSSAKTLIQACTKGDVYYISGKGYEFAALYTLIDDTNKIIEMYQGKYDSEGNFIGYTEWEDEFTLEIPKDVTKILYNSDESGSIYKNQTLSDVAKDVVTRADAGNDLLTEVDKLKSRFDKHIENTLDDTAVHLTQTEKDNLLSPSIGSDTNTEEQPQ